MNRLRKIGTLMAANAFLLLGTGLAQRPDRPPQHPQPQAHAPSANASRPPAPNQNVNRPPTRQQNSPNQNSANSNRPPASTATPSRPNSFNNNRPNYNSPNNGARLTPRQQAGV